MLRRQMMNQRAHELALYYLAMYGDKCTPEEFLDKVQEMEAAFLKVRQQRQDTRA